MVKTNLKYFSVVFCLLIALQETHTHLINNLKEDLDARKDYLTRKLEKSLDNPKTHVSTREVDGYHHDRHLIREFEKSLNNPKTRASTRKVDEYHQERQSKRFNWAAAANGLSLLAFTTFAVSASVELRLIDEGCCDGYDTCDHVKEYQRLNPIVEAKSKQLDEIYLDAENRMANAIELNYMAVKLVNAISGFNAFADLVLDYIEEDIIEKFDNASQAISDAIDAGNKTLEDVSNMEFEYETVFKNPLTLLITLSSVIYYIGYPIYLIAQHIKVNNAAQALTLQKQLPTGNVNPLHQGTTVVKTSTTAITSSITNSAKVYYGISSFISIISVVSGIWGIVRKFEACAKAETDSADTVKTLTEANEEIDALLVNATALQTEAHYNYNYIKGILLDEGFILYASQIAQLLGNATMQPADVVEARTDIEKYIAEANNSALSVHEFYDLTKKLLPAFDNGTIQMYCLTIQLEEITYRSKQCAAGEESMETLYAEMEANNSTHVDCTTKVDISYGDFKSEIEKEMLRTGHQEDCLLNSEYLQVRVCQLWYADESDVETLGITAAQEDYFISMCKPGDGTGDQTESLVCYEKQNGKAESIVLRKFYKYNSTQISEVFSKCSYKNITEIAVEIICLLKSSYSSLDDVLTNANVAGYDPVYIKSAYNSCLVEWSTLEIQLLCYLVDANHSRASNPESYEAMDIKHGSVAVDIKALECSN